MDQIIVTPGVKTHTLNVNNKNHKIGDKKALGGI